MSSAKKTNPKLWERIVDKTKAGTKGGDPGEWSARKAPRPTTSEETTGR
jgi:hypothetical protein